MPKRFPATTTKLTFTESSFTESSFSKKKAIKHRSAFFCGAFYFLLFFKGGVSIPAAFVLLIILAAILFWAWLSPHYDEFGSKILNFFRQFTNKNK